MNEKWKKVKALVKVFSLLFAVLFALYSAVWFTVAKNLKETLKSSRIETKSYSLIFNNPKVDGFPFKLRVELNDINLVYSSSLVNEVFKLSLDKVITETGPLFTQVKMTLPTDILIDLNLGQIKTELELTTKGKHYLRLKDQDFINTFKLAKFLYGLNKDLGINLGKLEYFADNSTITDRTTNKEIINSSGNVEVIIDSKNNGMNEILYKSNNDSTILAKEALGSYFHKISSNISLNIEAKNKNDYYSIPLIKINDFSLKLDNIDAIISGKVSNPMEMDSNIDLNLKLIGFNDFIQDLQKQKLISLEKQIMINALMIAATGRKDPSEIKIYTTKDGSLNIGNINLYLFSDYLSQINKLK